MSVTVQKRDIGVEIIRTQRDTHGLSGFGVQMVSRRGLAGGQIPGYGVANANGLSVGNGGFGSGLRQRRDGEGEYRKDQKESE